ncbi:MAG: hypothetical protein ABSA75_05320 [Candidatus Bathyarchaeia archaeon]|jgi:hypothetical protein
MFYFRRKSGKKLNDEEILSFFVIAILVFSFIFALLMLVHSDNTNLAVIPNDWCIGSPAFANSVLDTNITHNGNPSITIYSDPVKSREVDGNWIAVNPGDHIVMKCWIKTDPSQETSVYNHDPTDSYGAGARIGIDFYSNVGNTGISVLVNGVGSDAIHITGSIQSVGSDVPWNTSVWTLQTIDCIVPNGYNITGMIPWLQVRPATDYGKAWFADAQLYINPSGSLSPIIDDLR